MNKRVAIPVALGVGVVGLLLLSRTASAAESPPQPQPPLPPPTPPVPLPPIPPGVLPVSAAVLGDDVNLRSSPVESSPVVRSLARGARVTIPNTNDLRPPTPASPGGWYPVRAQDGSTGFVSADLLGDFQNLPAPMTFAGFR